MIEDRNKVHNDTRLPLTLARQPLNSPSYKKSLSFLMWYNRLYVSTKRYDCIRNYLFEGLF